MVWWTPGSLVSRWPTRQDTQQIPTRMLLHGWILRLTPECSSTRLQRSGEAERVALETLVTATIRVNYGCSVTHPASWQFGGNCCTFWLESQGTWLPPSKVWWRVQNLEVQRATKTTKAFEVQQSSATAKTDADLLSVLPWFNSQQWHGNGLRYDSAMVLHRLVWVLRVQSAGSLRQLKLQASMS